MKRIALFLGLAIALVASCSTQEEDFNTLQPDDVVFFASFEQPAEDGTRVYANEDLLLRWTADDRISIFGMNTYNQQYKFLGETGDNSGGFSKVDGAEYVTGNPISHTVSVYPYQASTKITEDEVITVTLPSEQHYAENSFGPGANTMVSVSEDNFLQYKNVGGYLMLKLYGEGVSVSSITLKGNNGEKLAGKATVAMPLDGTPAVVLAEDATDQITLVCDSPVALGATAEESKDFWFVVPPVTFSEGFTVTVSGNGGVFEKSTEKTVIIERNKLSKMAPIEVELTPTQPRNLISYTSTDGKVVTPYNPDVFGANIVSNEYVDGRGVITFDGDVRSIGDGAFDSCRSLASISIPNCVTSIGRFAFQYCSSLAYITIPESVTSIGTAAFSCCTSLMSFIGKFSSPDGLFLIDSGNVLIAAACGAMNGTVTVPDGVTSIGNSAFSSCSSLTSITIPGSVMSIGAYAFSGCSNLTNVTLPHGVTSIGDNAFDGCRSLISFTIPDSVTSIGQGAFQGCESLTSIIIPESVTSIGQFVFNNCPSLQSFGGKYSSPDGLFLIDSGTIIAVAQGAINGNVTIPDDVTSIGDGAFMGCSNLSSISIPNSVTSIGQFAFNLCSGLLYVLIPESVRSIGVGAYLGCFSLTCITIESEATPTGGQIMFDQTNNCPIYVPAESVEDYKSAQYWSNYADRIQAIPSSSAPVPEAVDLGLPSGLKWASFNLGASKPEEYGDYYAWGETEPYYEPGYAQSKSPVWKEGKEEGYWWSSYKWCKGSNITITKYWATSYSGYEYMDGKTVLDPEDDAAYVMLGEKWRMPTDVEWTELRDNCSWEWTSMNGINGRRVTGPNGKSIFLPAAGRRIDTTLDYFDNEGIYWSSSLFYDYPDLAWTARFYTDEVSRDHESRRVGLSIRPVSE